MTFDLSSPAAQRDPYPLYAEIRRRPGIARITNGLGDTDNYLVTRYAEVVAVLKDPRFANDMRRIPVRDDWSRKWYVPSMLKAFLNSMVLMDEPDHTRLRHLVHKAFTPAMIQRLSAKVEQIANELLDAAAKKPEIDFMADFALPLPLNVISEMMGVPPADRARFQLTAKVHQNVKTLKAPRSRRWRMNA